MTMSNRQLTINGLLACGWREVKPAPSRKYLTFERASTDGRMFVGKSGALRWCFGGTIAGSISLTDGPKHRSYREVGNPAYRFSSPQQAEETRIAILAGKPLPTLAHEIRQQITEHVCGAPDRKSRLEQIRGTVLANKQAGRGSFDGMESSEIAEYNRAIMFGDNDEAFPSQEEWSRIVD